MNIKRPSSVQVWTRVGVLIIAFVAILYASNYLKKHPFMASFFGDEQAQVTRGSLNLCPTRVSEVTLKEPERQVRYYQSGAKWLFDGPSNYEISPLFMEKWLAQHCSVKIDSFKGTPASELSYAYDLLLRYVDGSEMLLRRAEPNIYLSNGELIESAQLELAVRLLDPALEQ